MRTDEQRIEIVHQFDEMRKELDENGKRKYKNANEIAKILDVSLVNTYRWMDKFGLSHLKKDLPHTKKPRHRTSDVWAFFEQMPNSQNAKCTKCGKEFRMTRHGQTTDMRRHLQKKHQLLLRN
ncbi:hypothetical protein niasHS_002932 [Heterodera schachtii]|uniref:BED-type domain-containing protein n=1 Tax=Heterodera schachtii TaxID=97005 RepID=A0ABD2K9F7_HETSC